MKALVNVRTTRGFAHRVEMPAPELGLELVEGFEVRSALAQPFRKSWLGISSVFDLD